MEKYYLIHVGKGILSVGDTLENAISAWENRLGKPSELSADDISPYNSELTKQDDIVYEWIGSALDAMSPELQNYFRESEQDINFVSLNGKMIDFALAIQVMDQDLLEELRTELESCSDQEFVDAYAQAHQKKFGEDFIIDSNIG